MAQLNKLGCNVHTCIGVSGINAVRERDIKILKRFWFYHGDPDMMSMSDSYLKEFVRETETINALNSMGISCINAHFLRLSIYNNKLPDYEVDIDKIVNLLEELKPEILFVNHDNDPHATHGKVLDLVKKSMLRISFSPRIFLYRGAWGDFPLETSTMLYPFSKAEEEQKKQAILCHASQINPMFPGDDSREFWLRAQEFNRNIAEKVNNVLGSEFYAIEAFSEVSIIP
jgi:glucosamine-6-phosphate deaminase